MAVRARSELPHPQLKEKSVSGIPNDLLYAIMNKTDVGVFLSEKMRYPDSKREGRKEGERRERSRRRKRLSSL